MRYYSKRLEQFQPKNIHKIVHISSVVPPIKVLANEIPQILNETNNLSSTSNRKAINETNLKRVMHTQITVGERAGKISGAGGGDERERSDSCRGSEEGPAAAHSNVSVREKEHCFECLPRRLHPKLSPVFLIFRRDFAFLPWLKQARTELQ